VEQRIKNFIFIFYINKHIIYIVRLLQPQSLLDIDRNNVHPQFCEIPKWSLWQIHALYWISLLIWLRGSDGLVASSSQSSLETSSLQSSHSALHSVYIIIVPFLILTLCYVRTRLHIYFFIFLLSPSVESGSGVSSSIKWFQSPSNCRGCIYFTNYSRSICTVHA
jgi:hypothetical protein